MRRSVLLTLTLASACFPIQSMERKGTDTTADTCALFPDGDGDGYGDGGAPMEVDCDAPPAGMVTDGTDCDDGDPEVNPSAAETCDGTDENCDGRVDEAGATGESAWYADADGDGFGDAGKASSSCAQPKGTVADATDCDDADATVYPDAPERCDEKDNDCDAAIDEDLLYTWYADGDGDGYGDAATTTSSCDPPEGWVADATDCDDARSEVYPGAAEVCDEADQDCDSEIDEEAVDAATWYRDADGDGYGVSTDSAEGCDAPAGYTDNADDCDDSRSAVNPGEDEVCNDRDDDCDGLVDDDDPSLDTSTDSTWYADDDGDGLGDPKSTADACDAPAGYVDNGGDCDDTDATDTDADGTQDCADDDIDGDGLRNDWDGDEYDDSVVRGPTAGLGTDGSATITAATTWSEWTLLNGAATAGTDELTVDDATIFSSGDEVLVLSQQGTDAGQHQFVFVASRTSTRLTIEPPLDDSYAAASTVLVQRVPHYTGLTVYDTLQADEWEGAGGGVLVARATGTITVSGIIDLRGAGFEGGAGVVSNGYSPFQGESWGGAGIAGDASANDGGGGAYARRADHMDSGGGGGYGASGGDGTDYDLSATTSGGDTYGDSALADWFFGSGGGGGTPDTESDGSGAANVSGDGGDGGGLVALFAGTAISVSGSLLVSGNDGVDGVSWRAEVGGGGGGSGGQILLAAPTLTLSGKVDASGGVGGIGASDTSWTSVGGDGGTGRIRLEYSAMSGSTTPTAGSTGAWTP